jgi:hypothetical protein
LIDLNASIFNRFLYTAEVIIPFCDLGYEAVIRFGITRHSDVNILAGEFALRFDLKRCAFSLTHETGIIYWFFKNLFWFLEHALSDLIKSFPFFLELVT